jgi:DNA polymerase-3 subunit delta
MAFDLRRGKSLPQLLTAHRVWEKRKPLIRAGLERHALERLQQFLVRCAAIDEQVKGQALGDPWESVRLLAGEMAGAAAMAPSVREGDGTRPR